MLVLHLLLHALDDDGCLKALAVLPLRGGLNGRGRLRLDGGGGLNRLGGHRACFPAAGEQQGQGEGSR